jgi:acyl-CoA synthetase (AMP-forming)/AMP-acid ligase II
VKGPWIVSRYFRDEGGDALQDGWFPTGDVATIDADGFMQITDRSKDVIKSGGEWIGSIDLENIAMAHPAVLQAACIGVAHPKWDERPLLLVVQAARQDGDARGAAGLLRGQDREILAAGRRRVRRQRCRWGRPARSRRTGCASNTANIGSTLQVFRHERIIGDA